MTLAIFKSLPEATAAQDLVWRYVQSQGARGSAWADIVTDGVRYGFTYSSEISPAFDVLPELLEVEDSTLWTNATTTDTFSSSSSQLL